MPSFEIPFDVSPIRSLASVAPLDRAVERMRTELERDASAEVQRRLRDPNNPRWLSGYWYQRVDLGPLGFTTKSDHSKVQKAHGGNPLHTLFQRLSAEEGHILQPYTKWDYLQEIFPDVTDKTVLEIGSANGFFSLQFAKRGARYVNGIDIWQTQVFQATAIATLLKADNVSFHQGDAFYDSVPRHDVVYISEVLNHTIIPHHAFLRLLGLAKSVLVFDEFTTWGGSGTDTVAVVVDDQERIQFTGVSLSERAILTLCYLAGADLSHVTRWRDDRDPEYNRQFHTTFVIPMEGAEQRRRERLGDVAGYLYAMVETAMGLRSTKNIEMRVT